MSSARERRQAALAGVGNILSWGGNGAPADAASASPVPPTAAASPLAAEADGKAAEAHEVPSLGAVETARSADVLRAMGDRHALFMNVLVSRRQEAANVGAMWRALGGGAEEDEAGRLGLLLQTYKYLADHAHESVAVDVLKALAHCNCGVSVGIGSSGSGGRLPFDGAGDDDDDDEGADEEDEYEAQELATAAEEAGGVAVLQLQAGFPLWAWPAAPSLRWTRHVCSVLECLLYSQYEDYLLLAVSTVVALTRAVAPAFEIAAGCGEEELTPLAVRVAAAGGGKGRDGSAVEESFESDSLGGEDDETDGEGGLALLPPRSDGLSHAAAHRACVEAVRFTRASFPLLPAVARVAALGASKHLTKQASLASQALEATHARARHLLLASAAWRGGKQ